MALDASGASPQASASAGAGSDSKASPQPERGPEQGHNATDLPSDHLSSPTKGKTKENDEIGGIHEHKDKDERDGEDEEEDDDDECDDEEEGEVSETRLKTGTSDTDAESHPGTQNAPPLPVGEEPPPLPDETPPDDGWEALWDGQNQAYYFRNRFTGATQWENPRVPGGESSLGGGGEAVAPPVPARPHGGYNPAIHGDYDPEADYAVAARAEQAQAEAAAMHPGAIAAAGAAGAGVDYGASGAFNRFTGRWQAAEQTPEQYNDESKSRRQMNAFFDVDAAANSHGGRSLKAERRDKRLSKAELRAFKDKRREKKEEKRRAWLKD